MVTGMNVTTPENAADMIPDGATLMIGGFMSVGTPELLMNALVQKDVRGLTIIVNDTGFPDVGVGKLIRAGLVKKIYASHVGTNAETGEGVEKGDIDLTLVPQGTLIEKIRAGGAGLGGVLTPTGIGTIVAEGKTIITIDGREFILELPMKADFALIEARWGDTAGNLVFDGTTRNFSPLLATAADVVIAQVDEFIEKEYIDPNHVHVPGIFIDYIVRR
jgi:3-oxoacid CoA-transferase, A subunit